MSAATENALLQVLQELRSGNDSLRQAIGGQAQELQLQRDAAVAQMNEMKQMVQSISARGSGVVDIKQVGKPDFLKGNKDEIARQWPDWRYTFETWFCSQFANCEEILRWAKESADPLTHEDIRIKIVNEAWPDGAKVNAQLQVALVSLCKDEALTVIKNSEKNQGLDAWRRLNREYEPNNPQANLRLLKKVLQPAQQSIDTLRAAIETWEKELRGTRIGPAKTCRIPSNG